MNSGQNGFRVERELLHSPAEDLTQVVEDLNATASPITYEHVALGIDTRLLGPPVRLK